MRHPCPLLQFPPQCQLRPLPQVFLLLAIILVTVAAAPGKKGKKPSKGKPNKPVAKPALAGSGMPSSGMMGSGMGSGVMGGKGKGKGMGSMPGESSEGQGKGGKAGKCLSDEQVDTEVAHMQYLLIQAGYLCMEGTSLQAKMGPALTKCGMMPPMAGSSEEGAMSMGGSAQTRAKVKQH